MDIFQIMKNKRNNEVVTSSFQTKRFEVDSWKNGILKAVNLEMQDNGYVKKRKGYNTFGEMVDVLWNINKQNKKMRFTGEYTVILPLKGTKPIYKKTLTK